MNFWETLELSSLKHVKNNHVAHPGKN
uniref:Uncharacterized protein n=1 Tax=Rhizophora mucronata TaxID=61149 RepID=A0A2P2K2R0_RHIMU